LIHRRSSGHVSISSDFCAAVEPPSGPFAETTIFFQRPHPCLRHSLDIPAPGATFLSKLDQALHLPSVAESVICELRSRLADQEGSGGWWGRDRFGLREAAGESASNLGPLLYHKVRLRKAMQNHLRRYPLLGSSRFAHSSDLPFLLGHIKSWNSYQTDFHPLLFPTDVFLDIPFFVPDKKTLSALSRTCSIFCELASPLLFEDYSLDGAQSLEPFVPFVSRYFPVGFRRRLHADCALFLNLKCR
jgi:hypothetical protein